MSAPVVQLRGADLGYDEHPVVHGVDFALAPGEVVAVLGANGSGKTTLVRGILGLARLLGGSLELFGVPASRFRQRYRLGYVPQRHTVGGALPSTVREVVASGRLARRSPLRRAGAADRSAVEAAIAQVGLADRAEEDVARLSGGQQRRALIARALAAEPDVLVMDEPTAGVDSANQAVLAATLRELVAAGTTMLVVTHEVGPLRPLVTRTVVLREGRVSYDGPLRTDLATGGDDDHPHGSPPRPARGSVLGEWRP